MKRWRFLVAAAVLAAVLGPLSTAGQAEKTRNPFNVKDVPDPDGDDVKAFADKVQLWGLGGAPKDPNAAQWAEKATAGKAASLDGEWSSRWNGGGAGKEWERGVATVKVVGNRVYILYKDRNGTFLIDARREEKNRLVGRYIDTVGGDGTPWVGVVVDGERIDGIWTEGRWDLRRKLAAKKESK